MRSLLIAAVLASTASTVFTIPAYGQTAVINLRVDKLEKEMKAVQRKVFPGGAGLEPEINPTIVTKPVGTPANAPIADLTTRVDTLETQFAAMTGQIEQSEFRLKKLEDALKALRGENDARLKLLEAAGAAPPSTAAVEKPKPPVIKPPNAESKSAVTPNTDTARKTAVAAVEAPSTGDDAEDVYTYGFRLYAAKFYPEAQVKLKDYVAKYPSGKRASFARNLLGRTYLDEGKPALASVAFYDNYQKLPRGERAGESLSWLGIALMRLKKPADACKVYSEFGEVYGATASSELKAKVAKGRVDAKCPT